MKAFFPPPTFSALVASLLLAGIPASASEDPTISGPFTELRKTPLFSAEPVALAKTWGVALPVGTGFQVEKVYGRWIFGKPNPLPNMKPVDYAPAGWVYTRSLLLPGDADTVAAEVVRSHRTLLFHLRATRKKLALDHEASGPALDFLENLTFSRNTLAAFSRPEVNSTQREFSFFPPAFAEDTDSPAPMGLTGSDLKFLDQEIKVVQTKKKQEAHRRELKKLKTPPAPPLDDKVRGGILGRFMLERYLEVPPLTLEEVDGYVYMRATALRALRGCPKAVQDFWRNRPWNFFRIFRLKSRPEVKHPWFEIALPGGYFGLSGRAIELATNEAELAFVLVRQLAREPHVARGRLRFDKKSWPQGLQAQSEEIWDQVLKAQSTKDSANLDVSDEIEVDMQAAECLGRAGYRPMAAVADLRKLAFNKEKPWAEWFSTHSIGLDYRIDRLQTLIQESIAHGKFPEGNDSQSKRFASASKQWNVLP